MTHFRKEDFSGETWKPGKYLIATRRSNGSILGPGAIVHRVGKDEVIISSYKPAGYDHLSGSIEIGGKQSLAHLRDSLIEICKRQNIP